MFNSKMAKSLLIVMTLSLALSLPNFAYAATCNAVKSNTNCKASNICSANINQILNCNSICKGTSCSSNKLCELAKQCGLSVNGSKCINNCSSQTSTCKSKCSKKTSSCSKAKKVKTTAKANMLKNVK